ncbi:hypothetical protein AI27_08865 [Sphingomonas sp. BHC-A]|nr:hypothetical protein AI27_08865 [Sphingomonas sp. BHC-A]
MDGNTQYRGPGVGNVAPWGNGKFLSLITNPWLQVYGKQHRYFLGDQRSPLGGALMGESWEMIPDPAPGFPFTFTATVTHGSPTLTNCTGDLSILYPGDRLDSAFPGWPNKSDGQVPFRIWEVDPEARTITFGADAGAGPAGPFDWLGLTGTITVTAQKRQWFSLQYRGVTTGGPECQDMSYGMCNDVLNITGAPANIMELDLNSYESVDGICRPIFITGHGTAPNNLIAVDVQRAEMPWTCGFALRSCTTGMFMNVQQPFYIETTYGKVDYTTMPIDWGIKFSNSVVEKNALLEGSQLADGRAAIAIWRATDVNPNPNGRFAQFINAANSTELFSIFIDGAIQSSAPATANGSTTNSGSAVLNGMTLRSGTNLQLGQLAATATKAATGKYITLYDSAGAAVYVPTYA